MEAVWRKDNSNALSKHYEKCDSRAPDGGGTRVLELGGKPIMAGFSKANPYISYKCPFNYK